MSRLKRSRAAQPLDAEGDPRESSSFGKQLDFLANTNGQHDQRRVLGVDIGLKGALALLEETGELVDVFDMPWLADGPARRPAINPALLAAIIRPAQPAQSFVELVTSRPTDGAVQAFAFGRCRGVVEGVLAALGGPVTHLTAPQWKRAVGIPPGRDGAKDMARSEAIRRWPDKAALFARVKDDGRAEACLIGLAGLQRHA